VFAIRLIGSSWYASHTKSAIASGDIDKATLYPTRDQAMSAILILTSMWPDWIGKVQIRRVRKINYQKVIANRDEKGRLISLTRENVDHVVSQ